MSRIPGFEELFVRLQVSEAGFPSAVADGYRTLLREAHEALDAAAVPRDQRVSWIVPGRIEVLGKHVDYGGGRSLLCTAERGIALVARVREDHCVVLRDARRREVLTLPLGSAPRGPLPWSIYPRTVIHRLRQNFGDLLKGCDVALASNLPPAAGVSSSSALIVGLTLCFVRLSALHRHPDWQAAIRDRTALAGYIGALENGVNFGVLTGERGVGTMGGAQDQTAILCGHPGRLDLFSWAPVQFERSVTWPADYTFVIGVSGVVAAKTGGARERYNRAARTARRLVDGWNVYAEREGLTRVATLRGAILAAADGCVPPDVPPQLITVAREAADAEFSPGHLETRLYQFFDETFEIVPHAAASLAAGDVQRFGALVARSQAGAERALENQIAETVHLVRYARELDALASTAFGAGFGGSVWAMVKADEADRFTARWRERYLRTHHSASHRALFFTTSPSAPAFEVLD